MMSLFADAFQGSGVPLAGDPITAFWNVSRLGLRTATIVNNCNPFVQDIVKVRFIATNYGERRLEVVLPGQNPRLLDREPSTHQATTLLPGECLEYSVYHTWDAPGKHQVTLAYEARCDGMPFARLACPAVAIHVRTSESDRLVHWILRTRGAQR